MGSMNRTENLPKEARHARALELLLGRRGAAAAGALEKAKATLAQMR